MSADYVLKSEVVMEGRWRKVAPSHLISDYIEIAVFGVMFGVGSVTNGMALLVATGQFRRSTLRRRSMRQTTKARRVNPTQRVLRAHLLTSNLFIVWLYCPVMLLWLITYQWPLGPVACKLVHFLFFFSFCLSSNVVAL